MVAEATTGGALRASGAPGEMVEAAVVRVARASGAAAGDMAVRRAAENRGRVVDASWGHGDSPRRDSRGSAGNGLGCSNSNDHGGGADNGWRRGGVGVNNIGSGPG